MSLFSRRRFLGTVGGGLASLGVHRARRAASRSSDDRPNIVLIMADDLGAECLGCYGGQTYHTPHLDALARSGIQFTNAYSTPVCTPTRVQLMTGQYPFRNGWDEGIWTRSREHQYMEPELPQIGRMLQREGYRTAVAGKWQLARFEDRPQHPRSVGFEEHALWTWKYSQAPVHIRHEQKTLPARYWDPGIWRNGELMLGTAGRFGPDICADFVMDFIRRHRREPFFVYYPMILPHWPFVPPPGTRGDRDGTRTNPRGQENFEAMVEHVDTIVGRIWNHLQTYGLAENTLLLFTGDNGTSRDIRSLFRGEVITGGKNQMSETGCRVPLLAGGADFIPEGAVNRNLIDVSDIVPTLVDGAGGSLPADRPFDGRSFWPELTGGTGRSRDWIYVQRSGDWFIQNHEWRLRKDGTVERRRGRYRFENRDPASDSEAADAQDTLREHLMDLRGNLGPDQR